MSCHMLDRLCSPGRKSKAHATIITMLEEKIAPPSLAWGLLAEGVSCISTESGFREMVKFSSSMVFDCFANDMNFVEVYTGTGPDDHAFCGWEGTCSMGGADGFGVLRLRCASLRMTLYCGMTKRPQDDAVLRNDKKRLRCLALRGRILWRLLGYVWGYSAGWCCCFFSTSLPKK
jgi:hypothetical protein